MTEELHDGRVSTDTEKVAKLASLGGVPGVVQGLCGSTIHLHTVTLPYHWKFVALRSTSVTCGWHRGVPASSAREFPLLRSWCGLVIL